MQIVDRTKNVIKSLACVVSKEGAELTPQGLSEYPQDQVAK